MNWLDIMVVKNTEHDIRLVLENLCTYRKRRKIIPAVPTSLNELILQLKTKSMTTKINETLCHVDDESKIVIFT